MDTPSIVAVIAFSAWLTMTSLQLADMGTARFDARRLARGARTVVRLHPVAWVIPLAAVVLVGFGLGIDYAALLLFGARDPLAAVAVGLLLVVMIVGAWMAITLAVTKPADDSYRAIRDDLLEHSGTRMQHEWLEELRVRLTAVDSAGDRSSPPVVASLRSAVNWVFRRPQRVVPPLVAVFLLVAVIVASTSPLLVVGAVIAVALSIVLAVVGAWVSVGLFSAVRAAQVRHRDEAAHLLKEAERSVKKPVAGLGDRVARALQILREQQG